MIDIDLLVKLLLLHYSQPIVLLQIIVNYFGQLLFSTQRGLRSETDMIMGCVDCIVELDDACHIPIRIIIIIKQTNA